MTRRRPDVLILLLAIVGGYLAMSPTLRGTPNGSPANMGRLTTELPVPSPVRSVFRGVPEAISGRSAPPPLGASPSPSVTRVDAAGTQPAGTARPQAPTPSVSRPVAASLSASPSATDRRQIATPPPTLPPTDPPRKPQTVRKAPQRAQTPLRASARPQTASGGSGRLLTGTATYYCDPPRSRCTVGYPASGAYAAAGPALRRAMGDWRGRYVRVTADGASVTVRLIDCNCGPNANLIDLYGNVFAQLARGGLSQGVLDVTVTW